MAAGDKNDPFPRKWLKVHTQDLADPDYQCLTYEERGVLGDLDGLTRTTRR